jgi:hypothetical protein
MKVFIFNYGLLKKAMLMHSKLSKAGVECMILSSPHASDFDTNNKSIIRYNTNMYYGGLYNEAVRLSDNDDIMIINSDNVIKDIVELYNRAVLFFSSYRLPGVYAPSIKDGGTYWNYDKKLLGWADVYRGWMRAPITDGTCWAISKDVVAKTGAVDLSKNRIGWAIDVLSAMNAQKMGLHVVIDYDVVIAHPAKTVYDVSKAAVEERDYVESIGVLNEYSKYKENAKKLICNSEGFSGRP